MNCLIAPDDIAIKALHTLLEETGHGLSWDKAQGLCFITHNTVAAYSGTVGAFGGNP